MAVHLLEMTCFSLEFYCYLGYFKSFYVHCVAFVSFDNFYSSYQKILNDYFDLFMSYLRLQWWDLYLRNLNHCPSFNLNYLQIFHGHAFHCSYLLCLYSRLIYLVICSTHFQIVFFNHYQLTMNYSKISNMYYNYHVNFNYFSQLILTWYYYLQVIIIAQYYYLVN